MKLKKTLALALAVVMFPALAACASADTASEPGDTTAALTGGAPAETAGAADGTAEAEETVITLTENWNFPVGFYPVINSNISNNYGAMYWCRNFYNTLVSYDNNGEIKGELAESWDISGDGLVYTFKLRDGVKFSDGTELTSSAVETSFESAIEMLGRTTVHTANLQPLLHRWTHLTIRPL